jgi:hypothetical protein
MLSLFQMVSGAGSSLVSNSNNNEASVKALHTTNAADAANTAHADLTADAADAADADLLAELVLEHPHQLSQKKDNPLRYSCWTIQHHCPAQH